MWSSLQKLMSLADDTIVYCAHEYTQANAALFDGRTEIRTY